MRPISETEDLKKFKLCLKYFLVSSQLKKIIILTANTVLIPASISLFITLFVEIPES